MAPRLLVSYLAGQAALIAAFAFVPVDGWVHTGWQVGVGWIAAVYTVLGARRFRPEGALAWYLFAVGIFLNAAGLLVERVLERYFGIDSSPSAADALYLGLYVALVVGLGYLVYRRSAGDDLWTLTISTAVCAVITLVLAILAWEFIVWSSTDHSLTLAKRLIVTAYPLADLMVIAFLLRMLFGGGVRNPSFLFVVAAVLGLLAADIGWALVLRSGGTPHPVHRKLLEMASMSAFALLGAAALHPAVRRVAPDPEGHAPRLGRLGWAALFVSALTPPAVLLVQALLDRAYEVSAF